MFRQCSNSERLLRRVLLLKYYYLTPVVLLANGNILVYQCNCTRTWVQTFSSLSTNGKKSQSLVKRTLSYFLCHFLFLHVEKHLFTVHTTLLYFHMLKFWKLWNSREKAHFVGFPVPCFISWKFLSTCENVQFTCDSICFSDYTC